MGSFKLSSIGSAIAVLATIGLLGCSDDNPQKLLSSAKDYLAKGDNKAAVIQIKNALQSNPNLGEARFLLGQTLLANGDPAAAQVELQKASELKYSSDQVTPALARAMLMQGQGKKVIDELAHSELTTPESRADLQTTLGLAYLLSGKIETAQAAFDAALAVSAGYAPAQIGKARIKAGQHDLSGALALIDAALEKTPTSFEAWQFKGDLLAAKGDGAAAADAYRKALEIKPDLVAAHSALISQAIESGNVDAASKQLDELKKVAAKHPLTSYLQAQLQFRQKNLKAAQESIQNFLKVAPDNVKGLLLAGSIEYELKSYALAESYLLKVLPKTPEVGLARRLLIACYLRSGQQAKALATLQPVLDKIEGNSDMLALAGEVFMQNGDAERGAKYFAKSAELDPNNTAKRTSVALTHLAKGEGDTAYRELEQIASADSGIKADLALIAAQLNRRQYDKALTAIAALEKKQPDNPLVHNLRGSALLGKGDIPAARRSFEQALAKNPTYFPAAASLANLDLLDKKPEEARKRFENILAKDPKNIQTLLALAQLRLQTGAPTEEAVKLVTQAITANPTEPQPRIALVDLYLRVKDTKNALSAAQEALVAFPERAEVLDAVGRAQNAAGDYNQALATYSKLTAQTPNATLPLLRLAETQVAAKDKPAALQSLRKALAIKPNLIEAQRGIIMLELEAGHAAEALALARQVQSQRPHEPVGYLFEGDAQMFKKAWNEAAAAYRNGLKQVTSTELAVKLHTALQSGGNTAEAGKFAETYLKEHAKDSQFRLYLAESANLRKDYATAARHYRVLLELQPENPALLNNLAWTLSRIHDPKAIEYAEKAYKLAPDRPAIADTLGEVLLEKGDTARALELAQKAAGLEPKNAQIQLNLAKALLKAGKKDEAKQKLDELAKLGEQFSSQPEVTKLLQSL